MKLFILLALASLCVVAYGNEQTAWNNFKLRYSKTYENPADELKAKTQYFANTKLFRKHNTQYSDGKLSFSIGPNGHADEPIEVSSTYLLGLKEPPVDAAALNKTKEQPRKQLKLPKSINWVKKGFVSPVKDQGKCASDYAKAVSSSVEAIYVKRHGKGVVHLSAQDILDCTEEWGNLGCNGGTRYSAFNYLTHNKGINVALHYPYQGKSQGCQHDPKEKVASIRGYQTIQSGNEDELQEYVATIGPVTAAVDGSLPSFIFYSGGIYDDPACSETHLNHAVVVVGYGTEDGRPFWLIKNSWGKGWGENGYMKLARDRNQCGIASSAMYPIM